jgi:hypothetical protein
MARNPAAARSAILQPATSPAIEAKSVTAPTHVSRDIAATIWSNAPFVNSRRGLRKPTNNQWLSSFAITQPSNSSNARPAFTTQPSGKPGGSSVRPTAAAPTASASHSMRRGQGFGRR